VPAWAPLGFFPPPSFFWLLLEALYRYAILVLTAPEGRTQRHRPFSLLLIANCVGYLRNEIKRHPSGCMALGWGWRLANTLRAWEPRRIRSTARSSRSYRPETDSGPWLAILPPNPQPPSPFSRSTTVHVQKIVSIP